MGQAYEFRLSTASSPPTRSATESAEDVIRRECRCFIVTRTWEVVRPPWFVLLDVLYDGGATDEVHVVCVVLAGGLRG